MNYTHKDVMAIATVIAARTRVDQRYLSRAAGQVVDRKRHRPLTARDAALVAVEICATSQRRLAHDTGAENWY